MNQQEFRDQAESARRMPSAENSYRNLILNQRVNMVNPFVSREVWESCSGQGGDFVGEVYLGLDLSVRNDLTALIAVGKDQDGLWTVQPRSEEHTSELQSLMRIS